MKRSEMIEKIAKRLSPVGVSEPTCEEVLSIIEEAGMLPPRTKLDKLGLEDNAWDPEDNNEQRN